MNKSNREKNSNQNNIWLNKKANLLKLVVGLVFIRFLLSFLPSYKVDMGVLKWWSGLLHEISFKDFYHNTHTVYGPTFLYMLWISGGIVKNFHLHGVWQEVIIKFWPVLFDFIGGYFIYRIGARHNKGKLGIILASIYVLNPGVFFNSSIWGQFDSIPATMLLGVIMLFESNNPIKAVVLYTIAITTKPQSIFLAPLTIILFLESLDWRGIKLYIKNKAKLIDKIKLIIGGLFCSVSTYIILVIPFTGKKRLDWLIQHYLNSSDDYPYATANGFNFWSIIGGQIIPDNENFWGLTYAKWGIIFVVIGIIYSIYIVYKNKLTSFSKYYSAYIVLLCSFLFYVRMHERYLFPALIFVTVCMLWDLKLCIPMILISLARLGNEWYIYYITNYKDIFWVDNRNDFATLVAIVTMIAFIYSVIYMKFLKEENMK